MAVIQRPVKTYGTRTYVSEVAAAPGNEDTILANEVDGDLDTMYGAWNGGADTVNIKDGAVTSPKLGTNLSLGGTLTLTSSGDPLVIMGSGTVKAGITADANGLAALNSNHPYAPQDVSKSGWLLSLGSLADQVVLTRKAPGAAAGTVTNALVLNGPTSDMTLVGHARHKAYSSGIYAGGTFAVSSAATVAIPYETLWFNSGGQTAPNPASGFLFSPNFGANYFLAYADVVFSANGGLGCALAIQSSPDGSTWSTVGQTASKDQTRLSLLVAFPCGANAYFRCLFTNATTALNLTARYFSGVSLGGWN